MSDIAWPSHGHAAAEQDVLGAMESGRLHHAWLIEGPSGIGKARFARRLAAVLLGAKRVNGNTLDVSASDPVVEKMAAGGHPDFRWLAREPNEKGRLPLFIPVDSVREDLVNFFTLKPALGGKRVCVLDAVDELNASGANALLKSLEEPPRNCVLILIYHGQRAILATIRSRCRRLQLGILSDDEMEAALKSAGGSASDKAKSIAKGRPGLALELSEPDALSGLSAADAVLRSLDRGAMRDLPTAFAQVTKNDLSFRAFSIGLLAGLAARASDAPQLASAWLWVSNVLDHATRDSMDRGQTTAKLLSGLQERSRAA